MKDIIKHLATLYKKKKKFKKHHKYPETKTFLTEAPNRTNEKRHKNLQWTFKNQIVLKFEQSKQGVSQKDSFQSLKFSTNTHLFVWYFKEPDQLNLQLITFMYF